VWRVSPSDDGHALSGQGRLNRPIVILGDASPDWLNSDATGLAISFRLRLEPQSGGARLVFRYTEGVGYYALQLAPGRMILKRSNAATPALAQTDADRDREVALENIEVSIETGEWHDVRVWAEGDQIYVYLDRAVSATKIPAPQQGRADHPPGDSTFGRLNSAA
jgi:hypothetical protein